MTRTDEFIGQVESYLEDYEGSTPLPEAVRDAIRAELPLTRQRPAWWPARRSPEMNSFAKLSVAAAALVVAALLGFNYLVAPNVGSPGPGLDDPSLSPTPEPTATSTAMTTHQVTPNGLPDMTLTVTIPSDWTAFEDWAFDGPNGTASPTGTGLGFWGIANLYADPLDRNAGLAERFGPTADDLADALVRHPGWTVTEPVPVTIDGFDGQYLELTVPDGVSFNDCDPANGFWMWTSYTGGTRCAQGPGQLHRMWILDVNSERVVIAGILFPETPSAEIDALNAIVESAQIDPSS